MKLKKLFAGILAVAMMATMAAPAFAAGTNTTAVENDGTFNITKTLVNESTEEMTVLPTGVVAKLVPQDNGVPVTYPAKVVPSNVAIAVTDASLDAAAPAFGIDLPEYTIPGEYVYYLTEQDTGVAGIDVNNKTYRLTVYAIWDKEATDTASKITLKVKMDEGVLTDKSFASNSTKIDTIQNTYKAGTVTVTKKVAGSFARKDSEFDFNITLTSDKEVKSVVKYGTTEIATNEWSKNESGKWTVTKSFKLMADQTETISNIPYGVSYVVSEMNSTGEMDEVTNKTVKIDGVEYTVTYVENKSGEVGSANGEKVNSKIDATIKNVSGTEEVDTGVILDNAPYIALMMVVVAGAAVMIIKKRRHFED